ncbi:MAG: Phosphoglycolate phosphatase (EC [uncultured Sulfurovum sp.]|uniref:phosphoglycolate phosphatase n=1 Tax=uncultured Sulfurovum sp. TaxID=269237 RepID=A0A6S6TE06_9BACT|nr:MAG: Phosphoglycolate phosphatase (EC [uncultured Sulfurovum sp.]
MGMIHNILTRGKTMSSNTIYQLKEDKLRSKIILFDLDGTLIDSTEAILESFATAYKAFKVDIPKEENIKSLIGLPLDKMFIKLGVAEDEAMKYVKAYKEHYRSIHTKKTVLLPHAKEAIETAYTYARLAVVTTKTGQYSRELLEHFDLMKYFDVLIGREDVKNPKPHPEPIYKALDALGYSFGTITYYIGDTPDDMLAAEEADIASIGVLCGYGNNNDLDEVADFIQKDALKAVQLIEKI